MMPATSLDALLNEDNSPQAATPTPATGVPAAMRAAVDAAKQRVADLHAELIRWELVVWTAGNVSERVRGIDGEADLFVIKPSGVMYD
ncbi:MAG: hypothetical protein LBB54_03560, partial [Cellulomonadaceae bacterium]|nr:hypothetical protein [Cellulomonadaceae bacterium]